MKKIIYLIVLAFVLAGNSALAQKKKNKKKIPPIKAVVNVYGNVGKLKINRSSETDENIWNEYKSEKYKFKITFPSKSGDIFDDDEESAETFAGFEANTRKATYRLAVKTLNVYLDNSQLEEKYKSVFTDDSTSSKIKIISKKNVYLNGRLGKEFIYKENGRIYFLRFFIQEGKLYWLTVSLPEKEYTRDFDKWAMKFLESLDIETKVNQLANYKYK